MATTTYPTHAYTVGDMLISLGTTRSAAWAEAKTAAKNAALDLGEMTHLEARPGYHFIEETGGGIVAVREVLTAAAELGAMGGAATAGISTPAKRRSSKANGKLGGRPIARYRAYDANTGRQGRPRGSELLARQDALAFNERQAAAGRVGSAIVVRRDDDGKLYNYETGETIREAGNRIARWK